MDAIQKVYAGRKALEMLQAKNLYTDISSSHLEEFWIAAESDADVKMEYNKCVTAHEFPQ